MIHPFSVHSVLEAIDSLLEDASHKSHRVVQLRVGVDLKDEFEQSAGADFANGVYRDIPVSFDAIDPSTVLSETEPA
jgi:hypothetical protein